MTDIVERLNDAAKRGDCAGGMDRGPSPDCLYRNAADEITRLRAMIEARDAEAAEHAKECEVMAAEVDRLRERVAELEGKRPTPTYVGVDAHALLTDTGVAALAKALKGGAS